jgi:nicotinamide-nucleotide amidase
MQVQAELVAIGTELLLGQIVDTNATYIAQQLNAIGLNLFYKTTVGDNAGRIKEVLERAHNRSQVVITTGGIGPTEDDLTREMVAEATGRKLVFQQHLMDQIEAIFRSRGFTSISPNNRKQAFIPEGAIPIENPVGTAPGFIVDDEKGVIISIPGVPSEMKYLMEKTVIPFLKKRFGLKGLIKSKVLKNSGIGESRIDHIIGDLIVNSSNPTVGLLAHVGQVDIRITAKAEDEATADRLIAEMEAKIRERLPNQIFGTDQDTLEGVVAETLKRQNKTLAVAESNTGGLIASKLSTTPEAPSILRGCVTTMTEEAVVSLLGVPRELIQEQGLASARVAEEMASRIRSLTGASLGLGVAGILHWNEKQPPETPPTTFISIAGLGPQPVTEKYGMGGPASFVQTRIAMMSLEILRRKLINA